MQSIGLTCNNNGPEKQWDWRFFLRTAMCNLYEIKVMGDFFHTASKILRRVQSTYWYLSLGRGQLTLITLVCFSMIGLLVIGKLFHMIFEGNTVCCSIQLINSCSDAAN